MSYEIKKNYGVSDHYLVLFCYRMGEPNSVRGSIFRMNKKHLNSPVTIVEMIKLWNGLKETLLFLSKLRKIMGVLAGVL